MAAPVMQKIGGNINEGRRTHWNLKQNLMPRNSFLREGLNFVQVAVRFESVFRKPVICRFGCQDEQALQDMNGCNAGPFPDIFALVPEHSPSILIEFDCSLVAE